MRANVGKFTEAQIVNILKEAESGVKIVELCRKHGMSDAAYYNWKTKYAGLSLRKRRRKKQLSVIRKPLETTKEANEQWSMDFVSESLWSGRCIKILTIIDKYTRECPYMKVDTSINGRKIVEGFERIREMRGLQKQSQWITVRSLRERYWMNRHIGME